MDLTVSEAQWLPIAEQSLLNLISVARTPVAAIAGTERLNLHAHSYISGLLAGQCWASNGHPVSSSTIIPGENYGGYDPDNPENTEVPGSIIEDITGQPADAFDVMVMENGTGDVIYGFLEKGQAGMCNYNGMLLPALPTWDKSTYPYAVIMETKRSLDNNETFDYALWLSKVPMTCDVSINVPGPCIVSECTDGITWSEFGDRETDYHWNSFFNGPNLWVNHDVYIDESYGGGLYLAASDPIPTTSFEITWYDPATTNFKAKGWRRLSYHRQGDYWQSDDFTTVESGGWNYLKNIRSCTREKLYYNGVEVWPHGQYSVETVFEGEVTTAFASDDSAYAEATLFADSPFAKNVGDVYRVTINGVVAFWNCVEVGSPFYAIADDTDGGVVGYPMIFLGISGASFRTKEAYSCTLKIEKVVAA